MQKISRRSSRRTSYIAVSIGVIAVILASTFVAITLVPPPSNNNTSSSTSPTSSTSGVSTSTVTTTSTSSSQSSRGDSISYANDWATYHNDNSRTGYNDSSPALGTANVAWHTNVDAQVYAEPLYYNGLVYVATENNTVYGLDVSNGAVAWSRNLGTPVNSFVPPFECNNNPFNAPDIRPTIGITGTPVIDPASGTLYVAALVSGTGYEMYALNASNGAIKWNQTITAPGFNYEAEEERGALALANGMVYVPFGGFSWDCSGPNGWIIAISANGNETSFHYLVPANPEGDIWEPEGVSVDSAGYVYVVTGDSDNPTFDYGNSVLKLTPDLTLTSYFAASNWNFTNANDIDLSSTGATLLTGNLSFAIGKDGIGYLLNSSDLGGIGGQLYNATVCGDVGAWGSTSFAPPGAFGSQGIIYVPCASGLQALTLHTGAHPYFSTLWNHTGFWATPPIIAFGAVWSLDVYSASLYAFNPTTGALVYTLPPLIKANSLPHFTTAAAGGGLLLVCENMTVVGLNPA